MGHLVRPSFLLCAGALVLLACPTPSHSPSDRAMETQAPAAEQDVAVGRFELAVPEDWRRTGGGATVRGAEIEGHLWQAPDAYEREADALWEARLDDVAKIDYEWPEGVDEVILEERTVGPDLRGVLYHGGYLADDLRWLFLLATPTMGVWFEKEFDRSRTEEEAAALIALARTYRPDGPAPGEPAFGLQRGALVTTFMGRESAFARYEGGEPGRTLEVKTRTTQKPTDTEGLLGGSSLLAAGARLFGRGPSVVRSQARVVAGIRGKEEVVYDDEKDLLKGWWFYPGEANSGQRPRFEIDLEARAVDEETFLRQWDDVLASVRPLEAQPPRSRAGQ